MEIQYFSSFKEIDEKEWNELTEDHFPFLDHAYLLAMEEGGCVGEGTGWEPAYLGVSDQGRLVGASCLYEKPNSYGEYIFDWEWAHAFERYRQNYYPKLTSAVPFTPATGRKLLVHADADRAEVEKALTPNLCRCTGYKKIVDAIMDAAKAIKSGDSIALATTNGSIGKRHPRYSGEKFVLGRHDYTDDIRMQDMLYGALKFSEYPRAVIKSIDYTDALLIDGVVDIVTAEDIPGKRHIGLIKNDWPLMVAVGDTTCYIGDVIAGVIAEDEATCLLYTSPSPRD